MRTRQALINTIAGVLNQIVLAIVNIIIRRIMINTIGIEYLGVNGLFSNILSLLSLAESGFGVAIIYKLYRPLANDDKETILSYLNFYSIIYKYIALIVTAVGILLMPILRFVVHNTSFTHNQINIFYVMFLLNNVASYFIAYKTAYITACQKSYWTVAINTIVTLVISTVKIVVLLFYPNYMVFLALTILNTVLINIFVSVLVDRNYPYVKEHKKYALSKEQKQEIYHDCTALILHKIGAFVLMGTDNIIISAYINMIIVGMYSNYVVILNLLNTTLTKLYDAIVPVVGNIVAVEGGEKLYDKFRMVYFFSFLLLTFCTGMLLILIQPFICLIFGKDYLLDNFSVFLIAFNFFCVGMRRTTTAMKNATGVFSQDKYWALIEAGLNLFISIVMVKKIGLPGVFVGTIISGLLVPSIIGPYFLYRDVFHKKFLIYIVTTIKYYVLMMACVMPIYFFAAEHVLSITMIGFIGECLRALFMIGLICVIYALVLPEKRYTKRHLTVLAQKVHINSKLKR